MLLELFGEDSDDEGMVSPLDETPEFIISCKERIAPWIVKLLTPYYIKGRIKGKALFKALAKHLIRLIYHCSRHPSKIFVIINYKLVSKIVYFIVTAYTCFYVIKFDEATNYSLDIHRKKLFFNQHNKNLVTEIKY